MPDLVAVFIKCREKDQVEHAIYEKSPSRDPHPRIGIPSWRDPRMLRVFVPQNHQPFPRLFVIRRTTVYLAFASRAVTICPRSPQEDP